MLIALFIFIVVLWINEIPIDSFVTGGKAEKPAKFKIDASKAGDGGIGLTIEGPSEAEIKCDDHGDGTCSVEYFPIDEGEYSINILFADQHIPGSPFKPIISSDSDATKVIMF